MNTLQPWLLLQGTLLFLGGLAIGFIQARLRNPRMGLSAHLVGVQHGMVLWILPFVMRHAALGESTLWWLAGLAAYGLYAIWFAMVLSAVWGASRALPMAGAGHSTTPRRELFVMALVQSGAVATLAAFSLLAFGLWPR